MRHIKFKYWYLILFAFVLAISTIGSTYAFLTATASSSENAVQAKSTTYSLSMNITPVYSDFSFIPMDNKDALKALENKCKDKYDRGACSAYNIRLYDYNDQLTFISGKMDVTLDNISNLSYMMLEEKNEYNENSCVNINDKTYCISKEATSVGDGINLSLGDEYNVINTTEKNLILLIWLTNLEESQNKYDIGSFNSIITFSMGNGGEIKGNISATLIENRDQLQSEE